MHLYAFVINFPRDKLYILGVHHFQTKPDVVTVGTFGTGDLRPYTIVNPFDYNQLAGAAASKASSDSTIPVGFCRR